MIRLLVVMAICAGCQVQRTDNRNTRQLPPPVVDPCFTTNWDKDPDSITILARCTPALSSRCRGGELEACAQYLEGSYMHGWLLNMTDHPKADGLWPDTAVAAAATARALANTIAAPTWIAACRNGDGRACILAFMIGQPTEAALLAIPSSVKSAFDYAQTNGAYYVTQSIYFLEHLFTKQRAPADCAAGKVDGCYLSKNYDAAHRLELAACNRGNARACENATVIIREYSVSSAGTNAALLVATPAAFEPTLQLLLGACGRGMQPACVSIDAMIGQLNAANRGAEVPRIFALACYSGATGVCSAQCDAGNMLACEVGCRANNAKSCESFARALLQGANIRKDPTFAAAIASRGCAAGSMPSCEQLANQARNGDGLAANPDAAAIFFDKACKGGVSSSCNQMPAPASPKRESCSYLRLWPNVVFYRGCNGPHEKTNYTFELPCIEDNGQPGIAKGSANAYVCYSQVADAIAMGGKVTVFDEPARSAVGAGAQATQAQVDAIVARDLQVRLDAYNKRLDDALRSPDWCQRAVAYATLRGTIRPAC